MGMFEHAGTLARHVIMLLITSPSDSSLSRTLELKLIHR